MSVLAYNEPPRHRGNEFHYGGRPLQVSSATPATAPILATPATPATAPILATPAIATTIQLVVVHID